MYSEKKIRQQLDKYGVVCSNENNLIVEHLKLLCNESMDYLEWAIHAYYKCNVSVTVIELIMGWSRRHRDRIKYLSLNNIMRYRTESDIKSLVGEISFLDSFIKVKKFIKEFNTEQRGIMEAHYLSKDADGNYNTCLLNELGDMVTDFNNEDEFKRDNFYKICSSFHSVDDILRNLSYCIGKSYKWNREDMLEFMNVCAPDCDVVYDKDNIVIIRVPSYESAAAMCGGGRTQWCITKAEHYFESYIYSYHGKRQQFFYFDFNKFPTHKLANIGFTIAFNGDITNAHANNNDDIKCGATDIEQGRKVDIYDVMSEHSIKDYGRFFEFKVNDPFEWDMECAREFFKNLDGANIVDEYSVDGKLLVALSNQNYFNALQGTYISSKYLGTNVRPYVLIDFNSEQKSENSLLAIFAYLDKYDYFTSVEASNRADERVPVDLPNEVFMDPDLIPSVKKVFHFIDQNMERKALKVIENDNTVNVMEMLDYNTAICFALERGMYKLAYEMMKLDSFDCSQFGEIYGESFAEYLIYAWNAIADSDERGVPTKKLYLRKMMTKLISIDGFNPNERDITNDTALTAAAELPSVNWFTKYLLMVDGIDVNASNSIGERSLLIAARANNTEIVNELCQRPDIKVSPSMKRKCLEFGVNLEDYLPKKEKKAKKSKKSVVVEEAIAEASKTE